MYSVFLFCFFQLDSIKELYLCVEKKKKIGHWTHDKRKIIIIEGAGDNCNI